MREIIRLRHYAKSTEKTYLHWTRRFLAYRKHAGLAGKARQVLKTGRDRFHYST
ncbi:MAG: phage integrase N-terminal SAM-like domain-containing protein [Candidatus Heimdallarchaeota archaeon]